MTDETQAPEGVGLVSGGMGRSALRIRDDNEHESALAFTGTDLANRDRDAAVAAAYERAAARMKEKAEIEAEYSPFNAACFDVAAKSIRALATDTETDAFEAVRRDDKAEIERLREALRRIDEASNHYAMTPTYSEGTLRYAHKSTRNIARAALQEADT